MVGSQVLSIPAEFSLQASRSERPADRDDVDEDPNEISQDDAEQPTQEERAFPDLDRDEDPWPGEEDQGAGAFGQSISLRIGPAQSGPILSSSARADPSQQQGGAASGYWGSAGSGGYLVEGMPRERLSETWLLERYVLAMAAIQHLTWARLHHAILSDMPELLPRLRIMASLTGPYEGWHPRASEDYLSRLQGIFAQGAQEGENSILRRRSSGGDEAMGRLRKVIRILDGLRVDAHHGMEERKQQPCPQLLISAPEEVERLHTERVQGLVDQVSREKLFLEQVNRFVRDVLSRELQDEVSLVMEERQLLLEYRASLRTLLLAHFRTACAHLDEIYQRHLQRFQQLKEQSRACNGPGMPIGLTLDPGHGGVAHREHERFNDMGKAAVAEMQKIQPSYVAPSFPCFTADPMGVQWLEHLLMDASSMQPAPTMPKNGTGKPSIKNEVLEALKRNLLQIASEPPSPSRTSRLLLLKSKLEEQEKLYHGTLHSVDSQIRNLLNRARATKQFLEGQKVGNESFRESCHPVIVLENIRKQLEQFQSELEGADATQQDLLHRKNLDLQNRYLAKMQRVRGDYRTSQDHIHELLVSHGYYLSPFVPHLETIWSTLEQLRENVITQVTVREHVQDYKLALNLYHLE